MDEIILIGSMQGSINNGPRAVIKNLSNAFEKAGCKYKEVFLYSGQSKLKYTLKVIKNAGLSKNKMINVHTEGFLLPFLVLIISKINRRNKYFLTIHGIYQIESDIYKTTKKRYVYIESLLYRYFDNVICVSSMLADNIKKLYRRNRNIFIIGNGTDAINYVNQGEIQKIGQSIRMISVGGINELKGIKEILDIINYLINIKKMDVIVDIFGKKQNEFIEEYYNDYIIQHHLENKIVYKGYISNKEELYKIYKNYNFQLCLSKYDTFNIAVIESMALGCPCILSNMCGAKDLVIDGQNGFIVELSDNVQNKCYNILRIVQRDNERYYTLCKNAQETGKLAGWDKIAEQYLKLKG